MANKKRAIKIRKDIVHAAITNADYYDKKKKTWRKYSITKMANELNVDPRHLRRSINIKEELQPDQIAKIAELTNTPIESLTEETIQIVFSEDIYDKKGKLIARKDNSITLPKIGSDNYKREDLKEWNAGMDAILYALRIGERLHHMDKAERSDYVSWIECWIMLGNKYYGLDNADMLLETCETIAEKMLSNNKTK